MGMHNPLLAYLQVDDGGAYRMREMNRRTHQEVSARLKDENVRLRVRVHQLEREEIELRARIDQLERERWGVNPLDGIEVELLKMRADFQSKVLGRSVTVDEIRAEDALLANMRSEHCGDEARDGAGHPPDADEHQSGAEGS